MAKKGKSKAEYSQLLRKQAEQTLQRAHEGWLTSFDAITASVCLIDREGTLLWCNKATEKLLGKPVEEMVGHRCYEIIHGEPEPIEACPVVRMQKSRQREMLLTQLGDRWYEITVDPMLDRDGNIVAAIHVMSDVTEQKQAEKALRENEKKYRALFEETVSGCALHEIIYDEDGKPVDYITLEANREWERLLNARKEDVIGKRAYEAVPNLDREWLDIFGKVALTGEPSRYIQYASNLDKWFEGIAFSPQKGQFAVTFVDITERKRAEEALRASEAKYSALVEKAMDGIVIIQDGDFCFTNPAWTRITSYAQEELARMSILDAVAPESKDTVGKWYRARLAGEKAPDVYEAKIQCKDGTIKDVEVSATIIPYRGRPATIGILRDITERRQLEQVLKESEQHLRNVIDGLGQHIFVGLLTPDGVLVEINRSAVAVAGLKPENVLGKPIWKAYWFSFSQAVQNHIQEAIERAAGGRGSRFDLQARVGEGRFITIDFSIQPLFGESGRIKYLVPSATDITERKRAEDALRESEAKFRRLSEAADEGVAIHDRGTIIEANEALARMFGYELSEMIGTHASKFATPQTWEVILGRIAAGSTEPYEGMGVRKDGSTFHCKMVGKPYLHEGKTLRVATFRDITARKRAEDALEHKLKLEQTMAAISSRFVGIPDIDKAVDDSLADIGRLSGADRAYVFLFREAGTIMDNAHEWCAEGVTPQKETLRGFPSEMFPWWMAKLRNRETIHIADVSQMPPEASVEQQILEPQGIKSLLVLPMTIGEELAGFTGFDNTRHTGEWSKENFLLLSMASAIISAAFARKRANAALKESLRRYESLFEAVNDGIAVHKLIYDESGKAVNYQIVTVNPAYESITGIKKEAAVGKLATEVYRADRPPQMDTYARVAETGEASSFEALFPPHGRYFHVSAFCPRKGWFATLFEDITERKRTEEALQTRMKFEELIAFLSTNFINLALEEIDAGINDALAMIGEFVGVDRSYVALFDADPTKMSITHEWCAAGIEPQIQNLQGVSLEPLAWSMEKLGRSENLVIPSVADLPPEAGVEKELFGSQHIQSVILVPMSYRGTLVGFLGFDSVRIQATWSEEHVALLRMVGEIFVNALQRKQTERVLRESEDKLRAIFESSPYAITVTNLEGTIIECNQATLRVHGFATKEDVIGTNALRLIVPGDREKAEGFMERTLREGIIRNEEYGLLRGDGRSFMGQVSSGTLRDISGNAISLVSIADDITERKRTAEEVLQHNRELRLLNTLARSLAQASSLKEVLHVALGNTLEFLQLRLGCICMIDGEAEGLTLAAHNFPDAGFAESICKRFMETGFMRGVMQKGEATTVEDIHENELFRTGAAGVAGTENLRSVICSPFRSQNTVLGTILAFSHERRSFSSDDVRLLATVGDEVGMAITKIALLEKLKELSITDELTGLNNRRRFYAMLETEIERARRYGISLSLVLIDLDGFKEYNDSFGHVRGDAVLRWFARVLQSALRKTDTAFRYGGDEFAIIMPSTNAGKALKATMRLRLKWEEAYTNSLYAIGAIKINFSAGIAEFPKDAETLDVLISLADAALYRGKRLGGAQSTLASELEPLPMGLLGIGTPDQVYALASTVDAKDPLTYGHSKRVADIAEMIGKAIRLSPNEITELRSAALLHDIGKIGIPDSILNKPGKLTKQQWLLLKRHAAEGARIVSHIKDLSPLIPSILHHHEWYDGSGYPDGIKGNEIPLGARVICIADAYDTMVTDRNYRKAMSREAALEELCEKSGTQFDPQLVEAFRRALENAEANLRGNGPHAPDDVV